MAPHHSAETTILRLRKRLGEANAAVRSSRFMLQYSKKLMLQSNDLIGETRSQLAVSRAAKYLAKERALDDSPVWEMFELATEPRPSLET